MLARFKTLAAVVVAGCCSLSFNFALALGLGEITLNSTINEPLDASIELLDIDNLDESQIIAEMGSLQEFARTGVTRQSFVDVIDFEITVFDSQSGELRLTSSEIVVEPVLNFLINLRWPNGRLLREYTVLMDLPANAGNDEPQAVVQPLPEAITGRSDSQTPTTELAGQEAAAEPQSPVSQSNTPPQTEEIAPEAMETDPEQVTGGQTVVVQSGDNLWNIAADARGSSNVSVQQTMIAIQRLNPEAFINGNINMLRSGSVLRLPDSNEIEQLDLEQAVSEVSVQNQQAAIAEPLAISPNNSNETSSASNDELTILTVEIQENEELSSELSERIAALENQLMVSEESFDRARVENEELVARFSELESQIQILQDIIAIEDQKLAQLQAELASQAEETEQAIVAAETALAAAEQNAASTPVAAQTPGSMGPTSQPAAAPGLLGSISAFFQNTIVLIASLLVLVALVLWYLMWRRQAELEELEELAVADGDPSAFSDGQENENQTFMEKFMAFFDRSGADDQDEELISADKAQNDSSDSDENETDKAATDSAEDTDESQDDADSSEEDEDSENDDSDDNEDESDDRQYDDEDEDSESEADDEELEDDEDDDLEDDDEDIDIIFDDESEEDIDSDREEQNDKETHAELKESEAEDPAPEISPETDSSEDNDATAEIAVDEDTDELDILFEDEDEPVEAEVQEDDDASLEFTIDDEANDAADILEKTAAESEAADDIDALEFSLDDTENSNDSNEEQSKAAANEEDIDTLEFTLDETEEDSSTDKPAESDNEEEAETVEFSADGADDESGDDEASVEKAQASEEDLDLGEIDIDDSVFEDDDTVDFSKSTTDRDESSTKLDLAVAYEAMGDVEGAREILDEVVAEGNAAQVAEAKKLMEQWEDA